MAGKAQPAATPEVADQILLVRVADIRVGERLRPIDPVWARALGQIMLKEGQTTPIEICQLPGQPGYLLVAGGHRLDGRRLTDQEYVKAVLVTANAIQRRKREVSENVWRKELGPLDRSTFIAELVDLQKAEAGLDPAQSGQSVAAKARWADAIATEAGDAIDTMTIAYGWTAEVAETLGFSRKTIYRDLELHRGLRPDVAAQIRDTAVGTNATQLRALAKLEESEQRAIAGMIAGGDAKSVAEAQAMRDQKPRAADRDPQDVHFERMMALWSRMGAKTKRLAFAEIFARDPNLPADLKALLAPLKGGRSNG